jgi:hypothetical protein
VGDDRGERTCRFDSTPGMCRLDLESRLPLLFRFPREKAVSVGESSAELGNAIDDRALELCLDNDELNMEKILDHRRSRVDSIVIPASAALERLLAVDSMMDDRWYWLVPQLFNTSNL